jgi:hypothetical protein
VDHAKVLVGYESCRINGFYQRPIQKDKKQRGIPDFNGRIRDSDIINEKTPILRFQDRRFLVFK